MTIEKNKFKRLIIISLVVVVLILGFYFAHSKSVVDLKQEEEMKYSEIVSAEEYFSRENSTYNIEELKKMLENQIRYNYKIYSDRVDAAESYEEYSKLHIFGKYGMDAFFRNTFKNYSEEDILKNEITFMMYANRTDNVIDSSQGYMPSVYGSYEMSLFEDKYGRYDEISDSNNSEKESEAGFKFYLDNFEKMPYEMKSSTYDIVSYILPLHVDGLSEDFKKNIRKELTEKATKIRDDLKKKSSLSDGDKKLLDMCEIVLQKSTEV